jgi:deoxycytidylate deaminase
MVIFVGVLCVESGGIVDNLPKRLEPYFKIALDESKKSPCVRRHYGAMIVYDMYGDIGDEGTEWNPWHLAFNERVTNQCKDQCIRDRYRVKHGQNMERGAEIHAEQAALIKAGIHHLHSYFIVVGTDNDGTELLGNDNLPCHACAVMLKWAGYSYIYHKTEDSIIQAIRITDIIEYREAEIENSL